MGDMVGRKRGLIMSCLVFALGVGLQLDTRWGVFVIGRVIAGFGVVCTSLRRSFIFLQFPGILGSCFMSRTHVPIGGMVVPTLIFFSLAHHSRYM
jgi:MFS family permease